MKNKRRRLSASKMSAKVKPLNVSPLIKTGRYVSLIGGFVYGVMKYSALKAYESSAKPKRDKMLKEKHEREHLEGLEFMRRELVAIVKEAEIPDVPPGWEKDVK